MKKIDTKEVVKWVMEQPDDRTVDMGESHWSPEDKNFNCGCVMVQYGREVLGFEESFGCGISSWFTVGRKFSSLAGMDNNIFKVFPVYDPVGVITFKELRDNYLNPKYKELC